MSTILHTTAKGKSLDMAQLASRNENVPAVGNLKVNARGDELGANGEVIKTREEVLQDYYNDNPRSI